jgi:hypothetical protein
MKRIDIIFIFFIWFGRFLFGQDESRFFSTTETWYRGEVFGGEIKVMLQVYEKNENDITFELNKVMTPFSQVLHTRITAEFAEGKYNFYFTDGWGNKAFGSIVLINSILVLYLDCYDFSDSGKDLARLYGGIHVMKEIDGP